MNVMSWADRQLERFGEFEALVVEGRSWTNRELHEMSCRQAAALLLGGLRPGDRTVLWLPNGVELVLAFTAVVRAGGVAVILSETSPLREVQRALAETEARGLVSVQDRVEGSPELCLTARELMEWDTVPPLLVAAVRAPEDLAQIVYTSGSSGLSKPVAWSHGVVEARYAPFADQRPSRAPARRSLGCLPFSGSFGAQYLYLRLLQKMQLVLLPHFQADKALRALAEHRVQTAMLVPAMAEALLAATKGQSTRLPELASLLVGGATVSPSLIKRLREQFGVRASSVYGLTELGPVARTEPGDLSGHLGRSGPGVEIRIANPGEDGVGEVQVRAPGARATILREAPADEEWMSTGDLGVLQSDGQIRLVGRLHELIICGGNNVYPRPLEELLLERPEVVDCAVVGVPDPYLGEEVVAWVVGPQADERALLHYCRTRVDARRGPGRIYRRDSIPRNEGGKVLRELLREEASQRRNEVRQTGLTRSLAGMTSGEREPVMRGEIYQKLRPLIPREPTPRATFGEMELDSLGAVQLSHALSDLLGRPLPATLTFEFPTVEKLSEHLLRSLFPTPHAAPRQRLRHPQPGSPIAIVGAACRLPQARNPDEFWSLLHEGRAATSEIRRWNMKRFHDERPGTPGKSITRRAALLESQSFDASFFGLNQAEARALDPQHKLALEVSWEALESAGLAPRSMGDLSCGVFLGLSGTHWGGSDPLGRLPSMGAGRIAHLLDLRGPVLAIDTACSSGLVAVHTAVQNLRLGECDVALAGGVNMIASPQSFVALSQIRALSPDGLCKAFDASADGFGRGEGCVMLALRRLDQALQEGFPILAVIRGSAVNHDGRSSSLTAPHGAAQQTVARAALADAGLQGEQVDVLEAHGSGTPLGDPIEIEAAMAVYGDRERPLWVGSVKSNVGHLEAAAGAVGLLKAVLTVGHGEVPAHLHLRRLHPALEPYGERLRVPTRTVKLETAGPYRVAVTSLGMGGTNAVAILESPPPRAPRAGDAEAVLALSATTPQALREQVARYRAFLKISSERAVDVGYTSTVGREHFPIRLAVVGASTADLADQLETAAVPTSSTGDRFEVAFLLCGQGSLYAGAGRQLFESEPVFREALRLCESYQPGVIDALWNDPEGALAQPALFALEWSLAQLWASWGVHPQVLIGHSLGEYVAACLSGLFSLRDGLRLVAKRGALMAALAPGGGMLALDVSEERARELLQGTSLEVAALNGPTSTVVSGLVSELDLLAPKLKGTRSRLLPVRIAFHSAQIEPMLEEFQEALKGVSWGVLEIPVISTVSGRPLRLEEARFPEHWLRGLRQPVLFQAASELALKSGANVLLDIGPRPILGALARHHRGAEKVRVFAASLEKSRKDEETILGGLAKLYAGGMTPDWEAVYRPRAARRVSLPTYPFQNSSRPAVVGPDAGLPKTLPELVADVLDLSATEIGSDDDLLALGLDSLRVMQLLATLRGQYDLEATPGQIAARPTLAGLQELLATRGHLPAPGLIPLGNLKGKGVPLFCAHPAGGHIHVYFPLRDLIDPDRPLYALQSRALGKPDDELASLQEMAHEYTSLLEREKPDAPVALLGWSMGALLAHAMAGLLEQRGRTVTRVIMLDPPPPQGKPSLTASVHAALHNYHHQPPTLSALRRLLKGAGESQVWSLCRDQGWLERSNEMTFRDEVTLHYRHTCLLKDFEPTPIEAPVFLYWARKPATDWWKSLSVGQIHQVLLGGDHYSLVREPRIRRIELGQD